MGGVVRTSLHCDPSGRATARGHSRSGGVRGPAGATVRRDPRGGRQRGAGGAPPTGGTPPRSRHRDGSHRGPSVDRPITIGSNRARTVSRSLTPTSPSRISRAPLGSTASMRPGSLAGSSSSLASTVAPDIGARALLDRVDPRLPGRCGKARGAGNPGRGVVSPAVAALDRPGEASPEDRAAVDVPPHHSGAPGRDPARATPQPPSQSMSRDRGWAGGGGLNPPVSRTRPPWRPAPADPCTRGRLSVGCAGAGSPRAGCAPRPGVSAACPGGCPRRLPARGPCAGRRGCRNRCAVRPGRRRRPRGLRRRQTGAAAPARPAAMQEPWSQGRGR